MPLIAPPADGQQDAAGAAHVPMGAPWAPASAADMSPEDQQRLLQEKLAVCLLS
jgi:hypothetical protein